MTDLPPVATPRRRGWLAFSGLVLVLCGTLLGAVVAGRRSAPPPTNPLPAPATAEVIRTDLVERRNVPATLGYGATSELGLTGGTITELAPVGTVLERGSVIAEIDGEPVVLFIGNTPLWRELTATVPGPDGLPVPQTQEGEDVRMLQQNLIDLGVGSGVRPNGRYDAATIAAVKRWQKRLGVAPTGALGPGDAIVRAAPIRVAEQLLTVGSAASGTALSVTGTHKVVIADVDLTQRGLFTVGGGVEVKLPDGSAVGATVFSIGTAVVTPTVDDPTGKPTVEVIVVLDDPAAAGELDHSPVTVVVEQQQAADALVVPVRALLALAEGGYAVKVIDADGSNRLVGVETGAFANGQVEVTPADGASLEVGDAVEVAS